MVSNLVTITTNYFLFIKLFLFYDFVGIIIEKKGYEQICLEVHVPSYSKDCEEIAEKERREGRKEN